MAKSAAVHLSVNLKGPQSTCRYTEKGLAEFGLSFEVGGGGFTREDYCSMEHTKKERCLFILSLFKNQLASGVVPFRLVLMEGFVESTRKRKRGAA